MASKPDLAVIIVTWNVRDLALACLRSVYEDSSASGLSVRCVVVDNASSDHTAEAIRKESPQTDVIEPGENTGFARGNNIGLRALGSPDLPEFPPYVLLLNPDTVVHRGALRNLIDAMEQTHAGLSGARLIYGDGSFQHSAFGFPGLAQLWIDLFPTPTRLQESRINGRYSRKLYQGTRPFRVDHPLGATFMLRREVIQTTGLFDEQFHLYCEEIDWALRIRRAGWEAICVPTAEVVHYGGQSTSQVRPQSIINLWAARLRLYRKHYSALKCRMATIILRAGMARLIRITMRDSSVDAAEAKSLVDAYREVVRLSYRL